MPACIAGGFLNGLYVAASASPFIAPAANSRNTTRRALLAVRSRAAKAQ